MSVQLPDYRGAGMTRRLMGTNEASEGPGVVSQRVGERIRRLRRAREMTLADVAKRLGEVGYPLAGSGVSNIELGKRRVTVDDLVAFAEAFDVSTSYLLGGTVEVTDSTGRALRVVWTEEGERREAWVWNQAFAPET